MPPDGFWSDLGAAQYRARDYQGAVLALTKVVKNPKPGSVTPFIYLAMSHWKLGQKEEAQRVFHQAVGWLAKHPTTDKEQNALLNEAAALMGIKQPAIPQK